MISFAVALTIYGVSSCAAFCLLDWASRRITNPARLVSLAYAVGFSQMLVMYALAAAVLALGFGLP